MPEWTERGQIKGRDWRESQDERDARLDKTSANRRERLAREFQDERDTRLDRMSTNQRERLARESDNKKNSECIAT